MSVIIFMFGGRRQNVELQMPFIRRILDEHPEVEYHIWNLAREIDDGRYLKTLAGDRIIVRNDFYGRGTPWKFFDEVFRHYTAERYADKLFVKLDDDVVFLEAARFGAFLDSVRDNRDSVISANVINNGACTALTPPLWDKFLQLQIPLLDVHLHASYAELAHQHFFDHTEDILNQQIELVPTEDWLSINLIGYDHAMGVQIADMLGKPSPRHIAGRNFRARNIIGDEGRVNMLPRKILKGFTAGHLYFGPQAKALPDDVLDIMRKQFAEIGQKYLEQM